jgi:iron(III) transport system substrate-binding protein
MINKKWNIFKRIVIMIMAEAAMLLLSSCGKSERQADIEYISEKYAVPGDKQLVVYTSHKEEVYLPIIREFENRTGIYVEIHSGGTAEMFAQVEEGIDTGACDIMFGGGVESYEAEKDLFLPYEVQGKAELDERYTDVDNYWTPFTALPIVFIYNSKLVSRSEVPESWNDLFDEAWKGQIAFADPASSGTSYTILSTMEQVLEMDTKELVGKFYDQLDGKVLSSSGMVIPEVSGGKSLIGITLEETARKAMASGEDISFVYPKDGTSCVPDGCALVKNAPHSYNAGKFIDFIVGYDTQKYAVEKFYRRSVRSDINLTSAGEINQIDFDLKRSAAQEAGVLELWMQLSGKEGG